MEIDKLYPVRKIKLANTPFGDRIRIHLHDGVYSLSAPLSKKMINKYKKQRLGSKLVKGIKAANLALVIKGRTGEGTHKRVNVNFVAFEHHNPASETESDYSSSQQQQQPSDSETEL